MKHQITEGVYQVGALNPNMRVFDIVMKTEYGTSYNAYLIQGKEKTALVETVHHNFFDYYLENIREILPLEKIDYLIMNHNEPDHSGSIEKLLALNPHIELVVSQAGSIYLKNIVHSPNLQFRIVKEGDTLDLGGKTLTFISAPFLHWPDSIFSYLAQDKLLFCCDFLGAHYCEPQMWDTKITYMRPYLQSLRGYYDAIFGPFAPHVRTGLNKIKDLDIEYVCTGHGPVLTKKGMLPKVIELYKEWSEPEKREKKTIPIFFCSAYGYTKMIASSIAEGIKEELPEAEVECFDINDHALDDLSARLHKSDAFLIGSPTINRDAVPPVWNLLSHIDAINIAKRPVAVFGSFGWSGEAVGNLMKRLEGLKCRVFDPGLRVTFRPSEEDLAKAKEYGKSFVKECL